jgi:hypothetical protein
MVDKPGSDEPIKRKRGRPRKNAANVSTSEPKPKSTRKLKTPAKPDTDEQDVDTPVVDDEMLGAAAWDDGPAVVRRRRYQFVMEETVRHDLGMTANRSAVPAGYVINELVKMYCRGEVTIPIDIVVANGWLDRVDGPDLPQARPEATPG